MSDNTQIGGNGAVKWISISLMLAGFLVGGIAFSMQTRQDVRLIEQRVDIKMDEVDRKLNHLDTKLRELDVAIDKLYRIQGMPDRPDDSSLFKERNHEDAQRRTGGGDNRRPAMQPPTKPTQREIGVDGANPCADQ